MNIDKSVKTFTEKLDEIKNNWLNSEIVRKNPFSYKFSLNELKQDWKVEVGGDSMNEYKLYHLNKFVSKLSYTIDMDMITTIFIEYDTGFKHNFIMNYYAKYNI